MTHLTDLLDRASEPGSPATPIEDDLARAHTAWRRRRRNRGLVAIGSTCAVGLIAAGVAGTGVLDRGATPDAVVTEDPSSTGSGLLFAANTDGGPYTFGKLPRGWEVQGETPSAVTIARIGYKNQEPHSFIGKLVIMYDQNPPSGNKTVYGGREFFSRGDSGHTTVMVRTRAGEPEGTVYAQYPDSTGWSVDTMIEFLDAVRVNESAEPGLG